MKMNLNAYSLKAAIILDVAIDFNEIQRHRLFSFGDVAVHNDFWFVLDYMSSMVTDQKFDMFSYIYFAPDGEIKVEMIDGIVTDFEPGRILQKFIDYLKGEGVYSKESLVGKSVIARALYNDFRKEKTVYLNRLKEMATWLGMKTPSIKDIEALRDYYNTNDQSKAGKKLIGKPLNPFESEMFMIIDSRLKFIVDNIRHPNLRDGMDIDDCSMSQKNISKIACLSQLKYKLLQRKIDISIEEFRRMEQLEKLYI